MFTEYVENLTAVLLTATKDDLLKVRQDMSKKIPEPLTSQFTERRSREAAIKTKWREKVKFSSFILKVYKIQT